MSNPYFALLRTAWRYARHERKKYALIYFMFICSNTVIALFPLLFGWFVGKVQRDKVQVLHYAMVYATCYIGLKLVQWCFHGPARVLEQSLSFSLSQNFLQERYHQLLHLGTKWHQDHHSGASINRIRKSYEALRRFSDRGYQYINTMARLVFSVTAMIYFSPLYGGITVLLGALAVLIIRFYDKSYVTALNEVNEREHAFSSTLFDSLSNIMTVITLRLEKRMEIGLMDKLRRIFAPFHKSVLINEWKWFSAEMLVVLIYGIITVGYISEHWQPGKVFYIGSLATLLAYIEQFTSSFQDIAWQYTDIIECNSRVQVADTIISAYAGLGRSGLPGSLPECWKEIRLTNLNFSYDVSYDQEQRSKSLHDLHLHIQRGKKIALIGESGSGKSTLFALLRGLYDPEPGFELWVDGKKQDITGLHEAVTFFPQEPEIFENTIAYNVTLGLPFTDEEILYVCKSAHFQDVIEELPQGLASDIREKGVNLSGGQKQRLALARGILAARDSELVLLDEPTSSVDPRTEALIYEGLFRTFADKAIISSMHRLHLLNRFDYVYVLQRGRIVDEGDFEWLRDHSAVFQDLWQHQKDSLTV